MKKILVIFMLALLIFPIVSAQLIFRKGEPVELKIPANVDGSILSATALCTINVKYPNGTYLLDNETMNNLNNGEFNVSINDSQTTALGDYESSIFCVDGGQNGTSTFSFGETNSGSDLSTGQSIVYVIFLMATMFTFFIALFGAIRIPFKNTVNPEGQVVSVNDLKYLKVFLIFICYVLLLFIFGITKSITENFLFLNGAHKVFQFLYAIMWAFIIPFIIVGLVLTLVLFLQSKKISGALERGVPIR